MRRNAGKVKNRGVTMRAGAPPRWVGADDLWGYTTSITERRPITNLAADPPPAPATSSSGGGSGPMRSADPMGIPPEILGLPNRYFSAHALVFYFMHLDGDGKATRLKRYFDAIHEERKLWVSFATEVAAYEGGVANAGARSRLSGSCRASWIWGTARSAIRTTFGFRLRLQLRQRQEMSTRARSARRISISCSMAGRRPSSTRKCERRLCGWSRRCRAGYEK